MWDELGIAPCDDPKAIRRAYAARLKTLDPDLDPATFMRLREALEWALAEGEGGGQPFQPQRARPSNTDAGDQVWRADDHPFQQPMRNERPQDALATSGGPDPAGAAANPAWQWLDLAVPDQALLDDLETALVQGDAAAAMGYYSRAAAIGALPLHAAPPLLERLFAVSLAQPMVQRTAFRALARTYGWDTPPLEAGATSEIRLRMLARLAAENWFDALLSTAEANPKTTRKQAKLARLILGRIGRRWMPGVDRAALKSRLDEFRTHEAWLSDRINPAWAQTLEKRWRRREIFVLGLFLILLASMLLNGARLVILEGIAGTLSQDTIAVALFFAFVLLWLLKLLTVELRRLLRPTARAPASDPADDPKPSAPGTS